MANKVIPFTPLQKQTLKVASALVRVTWQICGTNLDGHTTARGGLLNQVQQSATDALLVAFDRKLVWALDLYGDPENASTYRQTTRLVRETQAKLAAEAAAEAARYA